METIKKEEYTIAEILQMAQEDDSWEKDPEIRERLINAFIFNVVDMT